MDYETRSVCLQLGDFESIDIDITYDESLTDDDTMMFVINKKDYLLSSHINEKHIYWSGPNYTLDDADSWEYWYLEPSDDNMKWFIKTWHGYYVWYDVTSNRMWTTVYLPDEPYMVYIQNE